MRKKLHRVLLILALSLLPLLASALSVEMDAQPVLTLEALSSDVIGHAVAVNGQADLSGLASADVSHGVSLFREDRLTDFVNTSFSAVPVLAFLYLFGFGLISLVGLSRRRAGNHSSSGQDVS